MRPWSEGYSDCSITVKAQASQGHSCNLEAGAHTRPLLCSTYAVSVSEPSCVHFVTNYDPYID